MACTSLGVLRILYSIGKPETHNSGSSPLGSWATIGMAATHFGLLGFPGFVESLYRIHTKNESFQESGPNRRPQTVGFLLQRHPQKGPLNFWKQPYREMHGGAGQSRSGFYRGGWASRLKKEELSDEAPVPMTWGLGIPFCNLVEILANIPEQIKETD